MRDGSIDWVLIGGFLVLVAVVATVLIIGFSKPRELKKGMEYKPRDD